MGKIENSIGDMKNDIMKAVEKLYMGKGIPAGSKWGPGVGHSQIPRAQLFTSLSPLVLKKRRKRLQIRIRIRPLPRGHQWGIGGLIFFTIKWPREYFKIIKNLSFYQA